METVNLDTLYGSPLMQWPRLVDRLDAGFTQAPGTGGPNRHTCWLATINRDGSPHLTGIGAMWVDDAFWFQTGDGTRKAKNLARDPRCTMSVATTGFDVMVAGEAQRITDPKVVADVAARYAASGWPAEPDPSGTGLTAPFNAPGLGPAPWFVYEVKPQTATAVGTTEASAGSTRWRF